LFFGEGNVLVASYVWDRHLDQEKIARQIANKFGLVANDDLWKKFSDQVADFIKKQNFRNN